MKKDPELLAKAFIRLAKTSTGISDEFLAQAEQSIISLFRDVEGEALDNTLKDLMEIFRNQAEGEKTFSGLRDDLSKLSETEKGLHENLDRIKTDLININDNLEKTNRTLQDNMLILKASKMNSCGDA